MSEVDGKQAAMDLAEASRQTEWHQVSFVAELFKGVFRWDLINPYPSQTAEDKAIGDQLLDELSSELQEHIDPIQIDRDQHVPKESLKALAKKGYFGMKISPEYGGLGLSVSNYARAMEMVGTWCGSTAVWLSAHQSIGVPQPLKLFGTPEQKKKYLPRLTAGAVSAFALTEQGVGSDPAQMSTTAVPTDDGKHYILNGEKLYITNGPESELLVVMAVTPPKMVNGKERKQISAFIVETDTPGFEVIHRCSFMGIRGIENGLLRFTDVKVPAENIIGKPGEGLKIALTTLNTGRLTIPAISTGASKLCLHHLKKWVNERVQWGASIGDHQAVQNLLAGMVAKTFAMESVSFYTAALADHESQDIRIEAAMAKYFASEASWEVVDDALQVRGGRGFESADSLKARGEDPFPVERMMRDLRINRIIEGTSEIMRLFIAREAMDFHVGPVMKLMSKSVSAMDKLRILGGQAVFYAWWYPLQWLPSFRSVSSKHLNRQNRKHLKYIRKTSKKLARRLFHQIMIHQQGLEKEHLIMGHFVDIGTDLFAMSVSLARAEHLLASGEHTEETQDVVDLFCRQARWRIRNQFCQLRCHHRGLLGKVSSLYTKGRYDWMVTDIITP